MLRPLLFLLGILLCDAGWSQNTTINRVAYVSVQEPTSALIVDTSGTISADEGRVFQGSVFQVNGPISVTPTSVNLNGPPCPVYDSLAARITPPQPNNTTAVNAKVVVTPIPPAGTLQLASFKARDNGYYTRCLAAQLNNAPPANTSIYVPFPDVVTVNFEVVSIKVDFPDTIYLAAGYAATLTTLTFPVSGGIVKWSTPGTELAFSTDTGKTIEALIIEACTTSLNIEFAIAGVKYTRSSVVIGYCPFGGCPTCDTTNSTPQTSSGHSPAAPPFVLQSLQSPKSGGVSAFTQQSTNSSASGNYPKFEATLIAHPTSPGFSISPKICVNAPNDSYNRAKWKVKIVQVSGPPAPLPQVKVREIEMNGDRVSLRQKLLPNEPIIKFLRDGDVVSVYPKALGKYFLEIATIGCSEKHRDTVKSDIFKLVQKKNLRATHNDPVISELDPLRSSIVTFPNQKKFILFQEIGMTSGEKTRKTITTSGGVQQTFWVDTHPPGAWTGLIKAKTEIKVKREDHLWAQAVDTNRLVVPEPTAKVELKWSVTSRNPLSPPTTTQNDSSLCESTSFQENEFINNEFFSIATFENQIYPVGISTLATHFTYELGLYGEIEDANSRHKAEILGTTKVSGFLLELSNVELAPIPTPP